MTLLPIDTDSALVGEAQYSHLPKGVSNQISPELENDISALRKFDRVLLASDCTTGAKLMMRVVSLMHDDGEFHFKIAGRVVECDSGRALHTFTVEESAEDLIELAGELTDTIADELEDVACTAGVQPPASPTTPPASLSAPPAPPSPQPASPSSL